MADDRTIELAGRATEATDTSDTPFGLGFDLDFDADAMALPAEVLRRMGSTRRQKPGELAATLLDQSISRFTQWIKNLALRATSAGDSSVNALYNEIFGRMASLSTEALTKPVDRQALEKRIKAVENRSKSLADYGFVPEFRGDDILTRLSAAHGACCTNRSKGIET